MACIRLRNYFSKNRIDDNPNHKPSGAKRKSLVSLSDFCNPDFETTASVTKFGIDDADFETAVTATKFGKFNVLLFFLSIPGDLSVVFQTGTMSYVFPAASCDLHLTLNNKGSLNGITYIGMVASAFMWGFLCDTFGRKKLMVIGYMIDTFCVVLSSLSQNYTFLIISKFCGGFIINGPYSALTVYLSEFHCAKYRSKVQLVRGLIVSFGNLVLPLLALSVLPQKINIFLFNKALVLHSWNIFLLICSIPSLLSAIFFIFMPESPKFLMTQGRNEKALKVFKLIYSFNTGKNEEDFPIKTLAAENLTEKTVTVNRTKMATIKTGLNQIKPLFFAPSLKFIITICLIQSMHLISQNTFKLWIPQIFQSISDYQYYHNGTTSDLCSMLDGLRQSDSADENCIVNFSTKVYVNAMIVATVSMTGCILAGLVVNKLGKNLMLGSLSIICGLFALSIYFSKNVATVVILSSVFMALSIVCVNIVLTITIDLFPTTLRTFAAALVMMCGRSASMVGNVLFPVLLTWGCAPPFFFFGIIVIVCSVLVIPLPNTEKMSLQ